MGLLERLMHAVLAEYRFTLPSDRRQLLSEYAVVDLPQLGSKRLVKLAEACGLCVYRPRNRVLA